MEIIKYPNPILAEKMPVFDFTNPIMDPTQLEKDMIETMFRYGGIGLAANQVGISTRVFVMGHPDTPENAMAFFNPEILETTDQIENMEEGCLSFPTVSVKIKRPSAIKARWQNFEGSIFEDTFTGDECKCFCHEVDHLEGIVFKDRVSQLKWALGVKQSKKRK